LGSRGFFSEIVGGRFGAMSGGREGRREPNRTMGARGTKPKENLSAMAGLLSPLAVEPPDMLGGMDAEFEYVRIATELAKLGHLTDLNRQCLVNY
jgi:hypothetical protein